MKRVFAFIRRQRLLARLRVPSQFVCWVRSLAGASLVYAIARGLRTVGVTSAWAHPLVGPVVVFGLLLHIHYRSRSIRARALEQMAAIGQAAQQLREALGLLQVTGASQVREALDHITWVLKEALPDVGGTNEAAGAGNLSFERLKRLEHKVNDALMVLHNLDAFPGEDAKAHAVAGAIQMLEKGMAKHHG